MEKLSNKKGISLISLIITIIVIIILAAIVIFSGLDTPEKAQLSKVISDIDNVQTATDQAYYGLYTEKSVAGEVWTKSQFYEAVATGELDREKLSGEGLIKISEDSLVKINLPKYEGRTWYIAVSDISDTIKIGSVVLSPGFESDGKIYATLLDIQNGGGDGTGLPGNSNGNGGNEENGGNPGDTNPTPGTDENETPTEPGTYLTNLCPDADWEGQVKILAEDEITNPYYKNNSNISMVVKADGSHEIEVPIPVGFTYYLGTGYTGLTIKDANGNQFVWIPVENAEGTIYQTNADGYTLAGTSIKTYKYGTGTNDSWGVPGEVSSNFREPDLVTEHDTDSKTYLSDISLNVESFANELVSEFDKMTESVKKYKGFYVGRYELGIDGTNIVCKAGVDELNSANQNSLMWYGLYKASKKFSSSAVQSTMIWGSQLEAMATFASASEEISVEPGVIKKAGEYGDEVKHINETRTGVLEWTLTARNEGYRALYGGSYYNSNRANTRSADNTWWETTVVGTRVQLYIK